MPQSARVEGESKTASFHLPWGDEDKCRNRQEWKEKAKQHLFTSLGEERGQMPQSARVEGEGKTASFYLPPGGRGTAIAVEGESENKKP